MFTRPQSCSAAVLWVANDTVYQNADPFRPVLAGSPILGRTSLTRSRRMCRRGSTAERV